MTPIKPFPKRIKENQNYTHTDLHGVNVRYINENEVNKEHTAWLADVSRKIEEVCHEYDFGVEVNKVSEMVDKIKALFDEET